MNEERGAYEADLERELRAAQEERDANKAALLRADNEREDAERAHEEARKKLDDELKMERMKTAQLINELEEERTNTMELRLQVARLEGQNTLLEREMAEFVARADERRDLRALGAELVRAVTSRETRARRDPGRRSRRIAPKGRVLFSSKRT